MERFCQQMEPFKITRYLLCLAVLWLWVLGSVCLAEEKLAFEVREEIDLSTRITMMNVNVGEVVRAVRLNAKRDRLQILFNLDVDISYLVGSYHRHCKVDAWYDKEGLREFTTDLDEDGQITQLSGKRKLNILLKPVIHIKGTVKGEPFNREVLTDAFVYTNIERSEYVTALTRRVNTWNILNLFTGEIERFTFTPSGIVECPDPGIGECYRVSHHSATREGLFHFTLDGLMVLGKGEDELGSFRLKQHQVTQNGTDTDPDSMRVNIRSTDQGNGGGSNEPAAARAIKGFFERFWESGEEGADSPPDSEKKD